ncbi:hypothetical protein [Fodinicola acaciae]|uniref:hypothetical protein n=1 Tax=Fodinicola acaciae TaxID=2681555 RepID=UPI0013D64A31|nr:hypothetical protein [Fodinicola acaciae]
MAERDLQVVGERTPEMAIGLFGPRTAVRAMMAAGKAMLARDPRRSVRFLPAAHDDVAEAADGYARLADRIDAAVFSGPWHYDLARESGYLSVPASYVRLSGAALYSTLLRGRINDQLDLTRISIDSLSRESVEEAYAEIEVDSSAVRCSPYTDPASALEFADFHRPLLESGTVTTALTTILGVEQQLRAEGFSAMRIRPTPATVREALETAVLLGYGTKLEGQQIAMLAVQVVTEGSLAGHTSYWQQEAVLGVHRMLLDEARAVGATVVRRSDGQFGITTTYDGLDALTSHLTHAPFVTAVKQQLGLPLAVGIGVGHTARDAEANAYAGLDSALERHGDVAVYLDGSDRQLVLSASAPREPAPAGEQSRAEQMLERIVAAHPDDLIVDVADVSAALEVTGRTGRRMLKQLVEAGLAWPLPAQPTPGGGRPRLRFRLLPTKISPESLSS